MPDMTIRNPDEMIRFAVEIDEYCRSMKIACDRLKSCLSSAAPMMRDEKSKKALHKIEALAEHLISGLPEAQTAGERLRESAKWLKEAQSVQI